MADPTIGRRLPQHPDRDRPVGSGLRALRRERTAALAGSGPAARSATSVCKKRGRSGGDARGCGPSVSRSRPVCPGAVNATEYGQEPPACRSRGRRLLLYRFERQRRLGEQIKIGVRDLEVLGRGHAPAGRQRQEALNPWVAVFGAPSRCVSWGSGKRARLVPAVGCSRYATMACGAATCGLTLCRCETTIVARTWRMDLRVTAMNSRAVRGRSWSLTPHGTALAHRVGDRPHHRDRARLGAPSCSPDVPSARE